MLERKDIHEGLVYVATGKFPKKPIFGKVFLAHLVALYALC
jgi:hypothetical protein